MRRFFDTVRVTIPGAYGNAVMIGRDREGELARLLAKAILEASAKWKPAPYSPFKPLSEDEP